MLIFEILKKGYSEGLKLAIGRKETALRTAKNALRESIIKKIEKFKEEGSEGKMNVINCIIDCLDNDKIEIMTIIRYVMMFITIRGLLVELSNEFIRDENADKQHVIPLPKIIKYDEEAFNNEQNKGGQTYKEWLKDFIGKNKEDRYKTDPYPGTISITPETLHSLVKEGFCINNGILLLSNYFKNAAGEEIQTVNVSNEYIYNPFRYSTDEIIFTDKNKEGNLETTKKEVATAIEKGNRLVVNYDVVGHVFDYLKSLSKDKPAKFVMIVVCRLERDVKYCSAAMKSIQFGLNTSSTN